MIISKSIFYSQKLNIWDKTTIFLYLIITIAIYTYFLQSPTASIKSNLILWYGFGTQMFLYVLNYKSLRNLRVYWVWIAFSFFHLAAWAILGKDSTLHIGRYHPAVVLRNTILLLVLFQLMRFISIKLTGEELAMATHSTDIFEEKRLTIVDYVSFPTYAVMTFVVLPNLP